MSQRTIRARWVTAVLAALGCVAGWFVVLGGGTHLVSTHGDSMAPRFSTGDLAVVRAAADYRVGDVVAYRSQQLDTVVMHRIVERDGNAFVLKGDNNDFLDRDRPTTEEFLGTLAVRIPGGGVWLHRATSPPALAAYAFLLLLGGGAATRTRRQRTKERRTVSPRHRATQRATASLPPALRPVAAGAVVVGLLGSALTGLAYTRPAASTVAASSSVESSMDFSYTAQVPQSAAYDGTTVTAPQPVFRALADTVEVTYRYAGSPGRLTVTAELSSPSGWRSTVALRPAEPVDPEHDGAVTLDLSQLQQRAQEAAEVIGIPASSLTVAVVPTVALDGGGTFAPRLELALDDAKLEPTGELTATGTTSTSGTRTEPEQLTAFGRRLPVTTARAVGPVAVVLALLAGLALGAVARTAGPVAEADRIRRRHGDLVLPVLPIVLPAGRPVVDVPDIESLARLAERYGLLVLTWSRGGVDTYLVQDEGTTYRYRHDAAATQDAATDGTVLPAR